ncbi:MAG TPA: hypothetical protein IAA29_11975 [Candidatus Paenibacillus intestinavium]|nr:hypothetical protein [Candidatus Paenibacillus intestinavium]
MKQIRTNAARPDANVERSSSVSNACYSRMITYQECIERGWDPIKYGLTPTSKPSKPKLVDPALNSFRSKAKILPDRPPRNKRTENND